MAKFTKEEIKNIIKEEVMKVLSVGETQPEMAQGYMGGALGAEMLPAEPANIGIEHDEYEGSMAKNNLFNLKEDATMLCDLIHPQENLEPWVEEKIAVAASMLNSVARYMKGEKLDV